MNKNLLRSYKDIKFESINKKYYLHNLKNDFHIIAIPEKNEDIILKEIKKWNIIKSFKINYSDLKYTKRVFDNDLNAKSTLYLVLDPNPKYVLQNNFYSKRFINKNSKQIKKNMSLKLPNFFITDNPHEFIEKFIIIFGFNRFKYLENNLLLNLKPLKNPLGSLGWRSFSEFISFANISCDWLVLRNFEFLPLDFFKNDKDVDILCRNKENFINKLNLSKRSWGISAYQTIIDGKKIPIDLRFLGDGYLDKLWQHNMLENKIFQQNLVPRPCDLDYFYSLIYHSKLQKNVVKKIYSQRLYQLKLNLGIDDFRKSFIKDDSITSKLLSDFMNINKYIISDPLDKNVQFNNDFYKKIKNLVGKVYFQRPPLFIRLIMFIPIPIRTILQKIKKKLINQFKR